MFNKKFIFLFFFIPFFLYAENDTSFMKIENADTTIVTFQEDNTYFLNLKNNVILKYEKFKMNSDSVLIYPNEKIIYSPTKTRLDLPLTKIISSNIFFNAKTKYALLINPKFYSDKWIISAEKLGVRLNKKKHNYKFYNMKITTCDRPNPHYYFWAQRAYLKDKTLYTLNTLFYVNKVPIFYFPFLMKSLGRERFRYKVEYRKIEGINLITEYDIDYTPPLTYTLLTDYYNYRGIGTGLQINFDDTNTKSNIFGYYINEKPIIYDVDNDDWIKLNSKQNAWKYIFNYETLFENKIKLKIDAEKISDNLFDKNYDNRGLGRIINELDYRLLISQEYLNKIWHISYEKHDIWNYNNNKFEYDYIIFPDIRYIHNDIYFKGLYYRPEIVLTQTKYTSNNSNISDLGFNQYLTKKIKLSKFNSLSLTTGWKQFYNKTQDNLVDESSNKGNVVLKSSYFFNSDYFYYFFDYEYEKEVLNPKLKDSTIIKDKLNTQLFIPYKNQSFYLSTGYDLKSYHNSIVNKKQRFDDIKFYYTNQINKNNKFLSQTLYNIYLKKIKLSRVEHKYNYNNFIKLDNSINFVQNVNYEKYYQLNTNLETGFPLFKINKRIWSLTYNQIIDLEDNKLKELNFSLKRDLHCFIFYLNYKRLDSNDQEIMFIFKLKAYPEKGLGIRYNFGDQNFKFDT